MKLIVAGGRDYRLTAEDAEKLWSIHEIHGISEVVSGGARGVDQDGEAWARFHGIPVKRFPADWKTHGRAAGPIRNRQMAEYADAVALFPGGRGTQSMFNIAQELNLPYIDYRGDK